MVRSVGEEWYGLGMAIDDMDVICDTEAHSFILHCIYPTCTVHMRRDYVPMLRSEHSHAPITTRSLPCITHAHGAQQHN